MAKNRHCNQLSYFVVFLSFISASSSNSCKFDIDFVQVLRNDGFHRNLTYNIVFHADDQDRWLLSDCLVGLDQELPAGVYTNPDELGELRRARKVNAIPKNKVNIELPTEQSTPTSVFMIGKLVDDRAEVWLPVHARYHQASKGGGFAKNIIEAPKLYLRCPNNRLDVCANYATARFLCDGATKDTCAWKTVPFTVTTPSRQWDVPIGNTDHYQMVAYGTAGVVVMGSLYILKAVHNFMMRERIKKK